MDVRRPIESRARFCATTNSLELRPTDHVLFHMNLSHAWSEDAVNWHWSSEATAELHLQPDGVYRDDHERPRVVLDENGDLAAILVGSHFPDSDPHLKCTDAAQLLMFKTKL